MSAPHRRPLSLRRQQRGVSLVISLIFLMVLAILGVTAAKNNSLQERMAGNTRNRDLAFQAAEAALKDAQNSLATLRVLAFDGTQAGLSTYDPMLANDADAWRNSSRWTSYLTPAQSLNQVAEQPRYRVERMQASTDTANPAPGSPCYQCPCAYPHASCQENYRVTARGVGGDANAVVVLQALYRYSSP